MDKTFRNWMLENEGNPELDIVMRKILDASASDDRSLAQEGMAEFKAKTGLRRSENWARIRKAAARIAACLFLPLLLTSAWALYRLSVSDVEWVKVGTAVNQTRSVLLPDGTEVRLSQCSQLFYPERFSGKQRKVMLVGEAFLDVAEDRKHQFVLSAGEVDVIVHGTRFSVSAYPEENESEVALMEGSVEMRLAKEKGSIFISPGELVKYDRSTGTTERRKFATNYFEETVTSEGLQFHNERLEDIVAALNSHFNVTIVIKDRSLEDVRFFASFINGESVDEILNALNTGKVFRVCKKDNITYLTK